MTACPATAPRGGGFDRTCATAQKAKQKKFNVSGFQMPRSPDLEAWGVFATVAETGSFVRAAEALGLSKATVSKAVARLEQRLGVPLLRRTSRRLSLTEAGERSAAIAQRMLAEAQALEAQAMAEAARPQGRVRLAAPMSFGLAYLAPLLPEFLAAHPQVMVDLRLSDAIEDLIGGRFDAAVRIADLADSSLRMRRLCRVRRVLVAAPEYFARHGPPAHPRDLAAHACLGYGHRPEPDRWRFTHASGETVTVAPAGPLLANNADVLGPALRAGMGIALQPEFVVWDDLRAGRVVPVLEDWAPPEIVVNIVLPPGRARAASVAALVAFLVERFVHAPWAMAEAGDA
jgi:DNA-binding transcriptional LysR family regulator